MLFQVIEVTPGERLRRDADRTVRERRLLTARASSPCSDPTASQVHRHAALRPGVVDEEVLLIELVDDEQQPVVAGAAPGHGRRGRHAEDDLARDVVDVDVLDVAADVLLAAAPLRFVVDLAAKLVRCGRRSFVSMK